MVFREQNVMVTEQTTEIQFQDVRCKRWAIVEEEYENGDLHVIYKISFGHFQSARIRRVDVLATRYTR